MWSRPALDDLRDIAERAVVQGCRVQGNVEALVRSPFPGMYRRVEGRPGEHVLPVLPHAVFSVIEGDTLIVLQLRTAGYRSVRLVDLPRPALRGRTIMPLHEPLYRVLTVVDIGRG